MTKEERHELALKTYHDLKQRRAEKRRKAALEIERYIEDRESHEWGEQDGM